MSEGAPDTPPRKRRTIWKPLLLCGVALPLAATLVLGLDFAGATTVAALGCLFACIFHFGRRGGDGGVWVESDGGWGDGDGGSSGGGDGGGGE